jgi:energy-coupling factor transporter ATP-binding protein EcfA2
MNPLFYLPSLAIGLVYALGSGNWLMLVASLVTALITLLVGRRSAAVPDGELRIYGNRVWLGNKRLPSRQIFWSRKLNERVLEKFQEKRTPDLGEFRALRNSGWRLGASNAYLVGVGRSFPLAEGAGHLLVVGPTGSGKSELLHLVLASVDDSVELAIADYKGGAVLTETRVQQATSDLDPLERQNEFWFALDSELQVREAALRAAGFASWEQAERQGSWQPRKLLLVDEVVSAIRTCPKALDTLTRIATKGRSLGMHLLVTSQSLVGIPREILTNLRSRLALSGTDEVELLQLGIKEKLGSSTEQTKAAVLLHDGQTFRVQVPLGARRVPRLAA